MLIVTLRPVITMVTVSILPLYGPVGTAGIFLAMTLPGVAAAVAFITTDLGFPVTALLLACSTMVTAIATAQGASFDASSVLILFALAGLMTLYLVPLAPARRLHVENLHPFAAHGQK